MPIRGRPIDARNLAVRVGPILPLFLAKSVGILRSGPFGAGANCLIRDFSARMPTLLHSMSGLPGARGLACPRFLTSFWPFMSGLSAILPAPNGLPCRDFRTPYYRDYQGSYTNRFSKWNHNVSSAGAEDMRSTDGRIGGTAFMRHDA